MLKSKRLWFWRKKKNKMKEKEFTVECNYCKQWLDNWVGSTPCCGSIAYRVDRETGEVSDKILLSSLIGVVEVELGNKT